jgi:DNA-binding transcriptional LysR family regulator
MHFDALRIFCEVTDSQSFTDAARRHGCTPANSSHSFHAMETELGQGEVTR